MNDDVWTVVDLGRRVVDQRWTVDDNVMLLRAFNVFGVFTAFFVFRF